jgi:peptidyl-prolyl cis-trans isomerase D
MVIEGLVEQSLLLQSAEQQGLAISQAALDQIIVNTPEFQVEGRFDRDQFNAMLRNVGLTPMSYRELLRTELLIAQEQSAITATAFDLEPQVQQIAALDRQTRQVHYQLLTPVVEQVEISDQQAQQYYQDNQASFMAAEQLSLEYLEVSRSDLAQTVEIDEAELQTQFEQYQANYEGEEARDAAHILIALSSERDVEQAKALADQIKAEIDAGADFAELAAKHSDDGGSAQEGGSLGVVEKGVMVPEFEEALFELAEGQVSAPVETEFGYHLIKVNRIEAAQPLNFDDVRLQLEMEQREQRSEALFVELSEQLADLSFAAADLQEPAEALQLEIKTTGLFGREGGVDAISADPRVLKEVFSEELVRGEHNSELIEIDRDRAVVVRVKQYQPARAQEFAEVKAQIVELLQQQQAQQQLLEQAQELLSQAQNLSLDQVQQQPWQQQLAERSGGSLVAELAKAVFKMAKPEQGTLNWELVELSDGRVAVVGLSAVTPGSAVEDQQLQAMTGFLAARRGQADYFDMVRSFKAGAEVERR